jgi:hypothetical protein
VELVASAHASRAKDEASRDLSRVAIGTVLFCLALVFALAAALLVDAAAAIELAERLEWPMPAALAAVAGANLAVGLALGLLARARLRSPVMVETRATLKRAAMVIRGS